MSALGSPMAGMQEYHALIAREFTGERARPKIKPLVLDCICTQAHHGEFDSRARGMAMQSLVETRLKGLTAENAKNVVDEIINVKYMSFNNEFGELDRQKWTSKFHGEVHGILTCKTINEVTNLIDHHVRVHLEGGSSESIWSALVPILTKPEQSAIITVNMTTLVTADTPVRYGASVIIGVIYFRERAAHAKWAFDKLHPVLAPQKKLNVGEPPRVFCSGPAHETPMVTNSEKKTDARDGLSPRQQGMPASDVIPIKTPEAQNSGVNITVKLEEE